MGRFSLATSLAAGPAISQVSSVNDYYLRCLMLRYEFSKRLTRSVCLTSSASHRAFVCTVATPSQLRVSPTTLQHRTFTTMPKRKSSAALAQPSPLPEVPLQAPVIENGPPPQKRRASARNVSQTKASTNPDKNANVLDAPEAFRASPDADTKDERMDLGALMDVDNEVKDKDKDDSVPSLVTNGDSDSPLSDISEMESPIRPKAPPVKAAKKGGKAKSAPTRPDTEPAALAKDKKEASKEPQFLDPEADGEEEADEEEIKEALSRPPPVNSDYLPLPWGGRRLGYVSRWKPVPAPLTDFEGLPEHLPPLLHPSSLQLPNLPYCLHPRKPPSPPRPQRAPSRDQKPPRQRTTRKHPTRPRLRRTTLPSQRPRHLKNAPLERPLRHQIHAPQQRNVPLRLARRIRL